MPEFDPFALTDWVHGLIIGAGASGFAFSLLLMFRRLH